MTRLGTPVVEVPVDSIDTEAFTVPTDAPEGDGTLEWDETTLVLVTVRAGGQTGIGFTYADVATAELVRQKLEEIVLGGDALQPRKIWTDLVRQTRNLGRPGIVSMAISAVDCALWDLKARIHDLPLSGLLGAVRDAVPVYGSGGFTTYDQVRLNEQLSSWVERGIGRVKMKVGAEPEKDPGRVDQARRAIGPEAELFVDANGAYGTRQAMAMAERFSDLAEVAWFEEPVSSDNLVGLRRIRERAPAGMDIAAGEYGYDIFTLGRMVNAGAVDVLQADVTRCGGITELLAIDGLCQAQQIPLSLHCGPAMHAHPATALRSLIHLEYFHDHSRIETMLFDGLPELRDGALWPDRGCAGNGLELKRSEAERYRR